MKLTKNVTQKLTSNARTGQPYLRIRNNARTEDDKKDLYRIVKLEETVHGTLHSFLHNNTKKEALRYLKKMLVSFEENNNYDIIMIPTYK
ncbi:hypothetical protein KUTeg_023636 [Tegillarca granosa]|uniref:Uncharacterized protein n=1 Tax=Tegillarca granosa TaxID=220873 RepID=A0ABQ9E742_TEGGR|nr:hypothetical protein KUTeg_023636 [Tegillarca granosa]